LVRRIHTRSINPLAHRLRFGWMRLGWSLAYTVRVPRIKGAVWLWPLWRVNWARES
jgi:hypothetical protein